MAQTLKDSVRQRILRAAEEMLYSQGPSVTMRQIAKAAGLTPGNLYRYYAGKEELLAAVTQPLISGLDGLVRQHTGEQLALGQTSIQFPLPYGEEGLVMLRKELYAMLVPALVDLNILAGQYPRAMAILCQQNEVNQALMDWFYQLMLQALDQVLQPAAASRPMMEILVRTEGQAFCQGVITMMQQCKGLTRIQQKGFVKAFVAIQIEGILWLIRASIENGNVTFKGEKA